MKSGTISVLGCGWLGLPLGKHLLTNGFSVKGSVTSSEKMNLLADAGIIPYRVVLNDDGAIVDDPAFFDCEVLIISIPPRRIEAVEQVFPDQIGQLVPFILKSGIRKVIFISSTSVYPDNLLTACEDDHFSPEKGSGKACLLAEKRLSSQTEFKTTVIRFGGLIGADRNPARFLLKLSGAVPNVPVNLIHQDDCIGILSALIDQECWGETLNACCPDHPMKKDFYGKAAQLSGLPEPLVSGQAEAYKIVDSSKLIRLLNYQFIYSSPMDYLDSMILT